MADPEVQVEGSSGVTYDAPVKSDENLGRETQTIEVPVDEDGKPFATIFGD